MGFHWTRCNQFAWPIPLSIAIICLIYRHSLPSILRVLATAIIVGCVILAGGMILAAFVGAWVMRLLMPHTLSVRGDGWITFRRVEANYDVGTHIPPVANNVIPGDYHVEVLPREAYERQDGRQLDVHTRRYTRPPW